MSTADVQRIAGAVRSHWQIENGLHWCLDIAFNEDQQRMREGSAARTVTTTSPNMNVITAVGAADVDCFVTIIGVIVVSATGNLELWANAEAGGATIDVRVGSALMLTRMA